MHVKHQKHHPFFGTIFLLKSATVSMLSHVFSYLASECSVCLQPYSVAHSSSKEWYVATKESLHWCHNNGRPWRCNNRSWMSLRDWRLMWYATILATLQIAGARQFSATPTQQSYWDKWETSHFRVCEWLSLCSGGGGCFDFEITGNSDNSTIFTHATAKNPSNCSVSIVIWIFAPFHDLLKGFCFKSPPVVWPCQVSSAHPAWAYRALQRWWCIWHSSPQKSTPNKDQHPIGCGTCKMGRSPSPTDIDIRVS